MYIYFNTFREPNFDLTVSLNLDNVFGVKYSNYSKILHSLEKYFNSQSDKNKYTSALNLKDIQINELLKADAGHLLSFAEVLLVMASISTNKEVFIERISEVEEKYMEFFLCIIEKYMIVEGNTNASFISHDVSSIFLTRDLKRPIMLNKSSGLEGVEGFSKMIGQIDILTKKVENLEAEKINLTGTIKEYHSKIIALQSENDTLVRMVKSQKEILESDKVELDIMKVNNARYLEVNDDFIKETININNLRNIILQKDGEIEEIKKESDKMLKTYTDQITSLNEKINEYEDKEKEYRQIKAEMDKLKQKNKELIAIKEKYSDYDMLRLNIEKSQGIIDNLNKEKHGLLSQTESQNTELIGCKEKLIQFEFEKKKIEYTNNDLQNKIARLESKRYSLSPNSKRQSSLQYSASKTLVELDLNERKFDQIEILEKEFNEVLRDKEELEGEVRAQTEQINDLVNDKFQLERRVEELKVNNISISNEIEKVKLAKDRVTVEKDKLDIELKNATFDLVKGNTQLEEQIVSLNIKLDEYASQKISLVKEVDILREQYNNTNGLCDRLLNEKKQLINDNQTLKDEIISIKDSYTKQSNIIFYLVNELRESKTRTGRRKYTGSHTNSSGKAQINNPGNTDVVENENNFEELENEYINTIETLRNDLEALRISITQKDENLKNLNEKVKDLDEENQSLTLQIQDNLEKYNIEINQRADDLEFLKRSYDDQKNKVNREHDLISSSLYELALQFMTLKTELHKKNSIVEINKK
jgi:chromosome segregation protein